MLDLLQDEHLFKHKLIRTGHILQGQVLGQVHFYSTVITTQRVSMCSVTDLFISIVLNNLYTAGIQDIMSLEENLKMFYRNRRVCLQLQNFQ